MLAVNFYDNNFKLLKLVFPDLVCFLKWYQAGKKLFSFFFIMQTSHFKNDTEHFGTEPCNVTLLFYKSNTPFRVTKAKNNRLLHTY